MPLYLSRLVLDPRSRAVRRDLADCHALHRTVMAGFPDHADPAARAVLGVLHRLDPAPRGGPPTLLVQAAVPPDWARLPAADYLAVPHDPAWDTKPLDAAHAAIRAGDRLRFRLRANPTRRINASHGGTNALAGKRVALLREEEQLGWLARKGEAAGFNLLRVRTAPQAPPTGVAPDPGDTTGPTPPAVRAQATVDAVGRRPARDGGGSQRVTLGAVVFEGALRVTDPDRLRAALAAGIGPGKAYGFGLCSVAPLATDSAGEGEENA